MGNTELSFHQRLSFIDPSQQHVAKIDFMVDFDNNCIWVPTSQAETRSWTDIKRSTDRAGKDIERSGNNNRAPAEQVSRYLF